MGRKKKSYNPFKMWGSWAGAGIVYLNNAVVGGKYCYKLNHAVLHPTGEIICTGVIGRELFNSGISIGHILTTILAVLVGFLIGWGIHSLFRRFSK